MKTTEQALLMWSYSYAVLAFDFYFVFINLAVKKFNQTIQNTISVLIVGINYKLILSFFTNQITILKF